MVTILTVGLCLSINSKDKSAAEFFNLYERFQGTVFGKANQSLMPFLGGQFPKIRVCVIDTGIDMSHTAIVIGIKTGAIKEYRSWIGDPTDIHDSHGHGTHMVELILKSSENVDIFVAKIANNANVPEKDIELIADVSICVPLYWPSRRIDIMQGHQPRQSCLESRHHHYVIWLQEP